MQKGDSARVAESANTPLCAARRSPAGVETAGALYRTSSGRQLRKNIGVTVGGNIIAAGFGILTLAFTARALGTAQLGAFALATSTAILIDRIFAFQTWMPLIKLGNEALKHGDRTSVGQITMAGLIFDLAGALASTVAGVAVILLFGERAGIPHADIPAAAIYMLSLITAISSAPMGLLRLLDRFMLLSVIQIAGGAIGALAALLLLMTGASLSTYLIVFAAVAAITNLLPVACGAVVALNAGIHLHIRGFATAWRNVRHELWSASWSLALSSAINVVRERAPTILIGIFFGAAPVGIYHIADRIAGSLGMAVWAVHRAFYPEISRFATAERGEDLRRFFIRSTAFGVACAAVTILGAAVLGHFGLNLIGGPEYASAYWPMVLLFASQGLTMIGIVAHAGIVAISAATKLLKANLIGFAVFAICLPFAAREFGASGAAMTQIVFFVIWLGILFWELRHWFVPVTGSTPA